MGDNDSKKDAKHIAFLEAKRLCVEQAGVFLQSNMKLEMKEQNDRVEEKFTKDIHTIANAVVKTKILEEVTRYVGGSLEVSVKVEASVDVSSATELYLSAVNNPKIEKKLESQQKEIFRLENRLLEIQKRLSAADPEDIAVYRAERKGVLKKISRTQEISILIEETTQIAIENIIIGMTEKEVIEVAGEPRSRRRYMGGEHLNYGKVWVLFSRGLVGCIVPSEKYVGGNPCGYYKEVKIK
jgi:hypothetical protein